ncbi:MAG: transposase [Candidatus Andersenbacteria bacterium]|nr:transposase [Candidatus Andersenbacteria bacterium]
MNKTTNISKRQHSADFKARVARAALRDASTVNQLASQYAIHTTQVKSWKRLAEEGLRLLFSDNHAKALAEKDHEIEKLHAANYELRKIDVALAKLHITPDGDVTEHESLPASSGLDDVGRSPE